VSPERPDQDDFLEDEEQEEYGQRSIFATGWFRAVLALLVLAVIAVIAVPLIGGWFEPTPPTKVISKPSEPAAPAAPAPTPSAPVTPSSQMPSAAAPPATPAPAPMPAPLPTPTVAPPAVTTPAPPSARPEMPAAATPKSAPKPAASGGNYWVQVGAFKESRNAEGLARKLRSEGFTVQVTRVVRDEPLHVVRVGGYANRSRAAAAREELMGKGQTGFVTSGPAK
jgi:cell division septation protein DedD